MAVDVTLVEVGMSEEQVRCENVQEHDYSYVESDEGDLEEYVDFGNGDAVYVEALVLLL